MPRTVCPPGPGAHATPPPASRRRARTGTAAGLAAAAALLVAACGADAAGEDAAAPAGGGAPATRTIEHAAGSTDVPADPERIVTTTDQNALLPLLELGVEPVASAGLLNPDGSFEFRRTAGLDTSGVEFVGAYGDLNLEAIAAADPDLIVGYEFDSDYYDELSAIAPTVLVATHGQPLVDALEDFAALVGREEEAAQRRAKLEERVAAVGARLDPVRDELTFSALGDYEDGTFGWAGYDQSWSVLEPLNLTIPQPQVGAADEDVFSYETLPEHAGDVMWLVDYSGEGGGATPPLTGTALWSALPAVQAGQAHRIDGTRATGAAWRTMHYLLDEVERTLLAEDVRTDLVEEAAG